MLSGKLDTEPSAEAQSSDTLTTGHMPAVTSRTEPLTTGRLPVVILGTGKKLPERSSTSSVKAKHRVLMHALVVFVLGVFILTTLLTVLPLGKDGMRGLLMNLVSSNQNSALVGAQAATATAIMQNDGYDPGRQVSEQYNNSLGIKTGGNFFPYGQCTYWANYRYHQLAGYWAPWSGNAYQWAYNAPAYPGWVISPTPHVPSIVVFQPGVQYASPMYGHVAVLEGVNPDGSLHTSNMNVVGYAFATRADLTNYVSPGVSFIYHV